MSESNPQNPFQELDRLDQQIDGMSKRLKMLRHRLFIEENYEIIRILYLEISKLSKNYLCLIDERNTLSFRIFHS